MLLNFVGEYEEVKIENSDLQIAVYYVDVDSDEDVERVVMIKFYSFCLDGLFFNFYFFLLR